MKNKSIYLIALMFTVVLIIVLVLMPSSLVSSTNSAYKTTVSDSDYARVAKWNIISMDKNGQELTMNVDLVRKLDSGSKGYWFFELNNASEVLATLDTNSSLVFKLRHNNNFSGLPNTINWNFLDGENPINFEVLYFNSNIDNIILSYVDKDNNEISINDFNNLNESEKVNYVEKIDMTNAKSLYKTSKDLIFNKKIEGGSTIYEGICNFDFSKIESSELIMDMNPDSKKTLVLVWTVNDASSGSGVGISKTYNSYELIKDASLINTNGYKSYDNKSYVVGDKTYYIVYKQKDYFDYLNTFGYEPSFYFPTDIVGGSQKVTYSKLTSEQKEIIRNYKIKATDTITEELLKHYVEKLTLEQYESFQNDVKSFEEEQGYLGYGLICNLVFNVRVSQVD